MTESSPRPRSIFLSLALIGTCIIVAAAPFVAGALGAGSTIVALAATALPGSILLASGGRSARTAGLALAVVLPATVLLAPLSGSPLGLAILAIWIAPLLVLPTFFALRRGGDQ